MDKDKRVEAMRDLKAYMEKLPGPHSSDSTLKHIRDFLETRADLRNDPEMLQFANAMTLEIESIYGKHVDIRKAIREKFEKNDVTVERGLTELLDVFRKEGAHTPKERLDFLFLLITNVYMLIMPPNGDLVGGTTQKFNELLYKAVHGDNGESMARETFHEGLASICVDWGLMFMVWAAEFLDGKETVEEASEKWLGMGKAFAGNNRLLLEGPVGWAMRLGAPVNEQQDLLRAIWTRLAFATVSSDMMIQDKNRTSRDLGMLTVMMITLSRSDRAMGRVWLQDLQSGVKQG